MVGVARGAVVGVQSRHPETDLVHVRLANEQRSLGTHALDDRGVLGDGLILKRGAHGRGVGRLISLVFDRHRHTVEGAEWRPLPVPLC